MFLFSSLQKRNTRSCNNSRKKCAAFDGIVGTIPRWCLIGVASVETPGSGSKNPFPNFGTLPGEPIERSDANPHLRGDSLPAGALSPERGNSPIIHDSLRPTEAFALGSRVPQSRFHTLHDQRPLQLRDCTQDGKHHLAGRRARVHLLRERNELNPESTDVLERTKQVTHRSGEAVKLPRHDAIKTAPVSIGGQPVQLRP